MVYSTYAFTVNYLYLSGQLRDERWAPDFGSATFTPSWGGTVTGVRKFLIAYNVNLLSTKEQAHKIALNLREKGRGADQPGRLKAVQGLGWWLAWQRSGRLPGWMAINRRPGRPLVPMGPGSSASRSAGQSLLTITIDLFCYLT